MIKIRINSGLSRNKNIYGGNRWVFNPLQKTGSDEQERKFSGNEFHIVGAAKAKERRPREERIAGIVKRLELYRRTKSTRGLMS
jgi:hypothetical protein